MLRRPSWLSKINERERTKAYSFLRSVDRSRSDRSILTIVLFLLARKKKHTNNRRKEKNRREEECTTAYFSGILIKGKKKRTRRKKKEKKKTRRETWRNERLSLPSSGSLVLRFLFSSLILFFFYFAFNLFHRLREIMNKNGEFLMSILGFSRSWIEYRTYLSGYLC